MAVRTGTRDPRTIITPDAFEVAPELLGLPLAAPRKRLVALVIDLIVVGIIVGLTKSFAFLLGVVAAAFFIRAGFKRTKVKGSVFGRAMRFSVGCFGLFIGLVTAAIWSTVGFDLFSGDEANVTADLPGLASPGPITGGQVLSAFGAVISLASADNAEEAQEAMLDLAIAGQAAGGTRSEIRESLLEAIPDDADWADQGPDLVEEVLNDALSPGEPVPLSDTEAAIVEEVAALSGERALQEYAALLAEDPPSLRRNALQARLATEIAGDSLGALTQRIADLRSESEQRARRIDAVNDQLEEATSGGLLSSLRGFLDDLGFGFGWASLYLTIMLSWWNGQTVGKKLMRIRVVRLDGEPIDWWVAFERGGGYAAGFATGLLGFAQVYWDANRQAIHDHIVGTVVVIEGAAKVGNWEEAL